MRLSSHLGGRRGSDLLPSGEVVEEGKGDDEDEEAPGNGRDV